jgi:hypothetical protein
MRTLPKNRDYYIMAKFRLWLQIASAGTTKTEREKARRNFKHLLEKYPYIAVKNGWTLADLPGRV